MNSCLRAADILLPRKGTDLSRWPVVACDQFTGREAYWREAERIVGDAPSTLNLIFPEVWLGCGGEDERICRINRAMEEAERSVLEVAVRDGFVLVRRSCPGGVRLGLVGKIDLEDYDYRPGAGTLIRATEGTILSRIPPRVKIREHASLELPHIMMLLDDPCGRLIEALDARRGEMRKLYETELMLEGGHLEGYAVEGPLARETEEVISQLQAACGGFFLAAGDGNHSLATAKACWQMRKESLSEQEQLEDPARFALCEVVNVHSPALVFRPIHRILEGEGAQQLHAAFKENVRSCGMELVPGEEILLLDGQGRHPLSVQGRGDRLPVDVLQACLDAFLEAHPAVTIDYLHDSSDVEAAVARGGVGMLLQPMDKSALFPAISAGGVLPRKTFSMGEGNEKRYYMECRRIRRTR